jgi:signal transduction histidine kinase
VEDTEQNEDQLLSALAALRAENAALHLQVTGDESSALKRRLAVERMRAEAMAMRSSDDLLKVMRMMSEEMVGLGIAISRLNIRFLEVQGDEVHISKSYYTVPNPKKYGISWTSPLLVDLDEEAAVGEVVEGRSSSSPRHLKIIEAWQRMEIVSFAVDVAEGIARVSGIVDSLRHFARLDEAEFQLDDLHGGIDSALVLLGSQIGEHITVRKNYGDIEPIYCSPGQLNQVFMHLLKNALQAIEGSGEINISTFATDAAVCVCVCIGDSGSGIAPERLERIFDFDFHATGQRMKMGFGLSIDDTVHLHLSRSMM